MRAAALVEAEADRVMMNTRASASYGSEAGEGEAEGFRGALPARRPER